MRVLHSFFIQSLGNLVCLGFSAHLNLDMERSSVILDLLQVHKFCRRKSRFINLSCPNTLRSFLINKTTVSS